MDSETKMAKLLVNINRPQHFDPHIVQDMLDELGDRWRVLWEELPTDQNFDSLYGANARYEAFIYKSVLFERKTIEPERKVWEATEPRNEMSDDNFTVEWLLDNTPFECCVPIADLYRYAKGLNVGHSPWALFLRITGYYDSEIFNADDSLPIGGNDAISIGAATATWGEYADVVDGYIELIRHYEVIDC